MNDMKPKHTFLYLVLFACGIYSSGVDAQAITTVAGSGYGAGAGTGGYSGDGGPAGAAKLFNPTGVVTYGYNNIYIADQANHSIRKVNYLGIISTVAGNDTAGNTGNGKAATAARLNTPHGLAVDGLGNIYIADHASNVIRKVNTAGIISTVAGTGTAGYTGDGGPATAAKLNAPYGVAIDGIGNLYIADLNNNVIRMVNIYGVMSTFAGNGYGAGLGHGGYTGDGGAATAAELSLPAGVGTDVFGNVYIADTRNNVIRKVNSSGVISTVAGNGSAGYAGDGGAATNARLTLPAGIAADGPGNLYIADQGNNVVRKVTTGGAITTLAGTIAPGYAGDGGAATAAQLNSPAGVAVDGNGLVYIADYGNNAVRMVGGTAGVNDLNAGGNELKVYPNPSTGSFAIEIPQTGYTSTVTVVDVLGRQVAAEVIQTTNIPKSVITLHNIPSGNYIVKVSSGGQVLRAEVAVH